MELETSTFFGRFIEALGQMVGAFERVGLGAGSELLGVVLPYLGTIALFVAFYLSYHLLRSGIGVRATPDYRQLGAARHAKNAAARSLRLFVPGCLAMAAGIGLLVIRGDAAYLALLPTLLMVAGGTGLIWVGYRIQSGTPPVPLGRLGSVFSGDVRSAAFIAVGLFVALLALASLNTRVSVSVEAHPTTQRERVDAIDEKLGEIVGVISEFRAEGSTESPE